MQFLLHQRLTATLLMGTLLLLILAADAWTQLGFAHGVLYVPLLLLTVACKRPGLLWPLVFITLAFTWLGFLISPAAPEDFSMLYVLANRLLATAAILATGWLLAYLRRAEFQHLRQQLLMDEQLQDLVAEKERFIALSKTLPLSIWTANNEGEIDFVSEQLSGQLGVDSETLKQHWPDYIHPEDRQSTLDAWQKGLKQGKEYRHEFRFRYAQGNYVWHLLTAIPLREKDGSIRGWLGSSMSIHDQKQLLQEKDKLLERLNIVLESIADGFATLDENLCFTYVNEMATQVLNQSEEELLGQAFVEHPVVQQGRATIEAVQQVMRTGQPRQLEDNTHAGNWYSLSIYPFQGGVSIYFRDITEQHKAQEELKLLRTAVSRLNDVIIITEAEPMTAPGPRIVFVNEAFERITGYSKEEVIGQSPRLLQGPGTQQAEAKRIGHAMRKWQSVRGELLNYKKNGEAFWFELDIVPLADETGWFTHWVAVERDITEKKELQQQLQHSQRMESIGQLTGGIAHDFNNLLTVISGNLELLVELLDKEPRLQALAKTSARAADRGAQLTRGLLTFARKQILQPRDININFLMQEMLPLLNSSVGERMEIHLAPEENLWTALIDESYLESSLLNLVINARDASPEGGVVQLETANVTLDDDYAARHAEVLPGDYVMLAISDHGTGIHPDILDHIFEPFFTTKDKARGTGLGLSMVFGFIKQSGGHISVYSEPEQGSCFRLYLPRANGYKPQQPADKPADKNKSGGKTLLIAEDNDLVREFAVIQLEDAGYRVIEAETGDQALAILESGSGQAIDLLFTDIIMPGQLNGLQLAEKANQLYPELPIIFTSGFTENALPQQFGKQLPAKMLGKPYKRQALLETIAEGLGSP
ncbi:PAS domain S-box protein [Marinospirillum sp.]|uniref:hybrid sensor histidine kinase/response regulator n=1 Tax=Marinospirillum sp. TaxID=2183934 RepID=UPI0038507D6B